MTATTKPMTAEDRVKVEKGEDGRYGVYLCGVDGIYLQSFRTEVCAEKFHKEIIAQFQSTRDDAVREFVDLLRKNCPHGCTNCEQAARKASYIRTEMGVTI